MPSDAELLRPLLLEGRAARLDAVLTARLGGVTTVLEELRDEGNVSAVLRTCEAMGVQDVHVVPERGTRYRVVAPITQGCERWLDVHVENGITECLTELRARGFRIYGSYLGGEAGRLDDLDFSVPAALVFGNEQRGVSRAARAHCDRLFAIPMAGMTRSYNVSVAAGLTLWAATRARRAALGRPGDLSEKEAEALRDRWYRAEVRDVDRVLARLRGS